MDSPGTLEEMLAKGRRPYGLARCRVFERAGDFMETSPFGERVHPVTGERSFHAGVDGAVWTGSALGESWIVAPLAGVVAAAEDGVDGFSRERPAGNFVELDHGGGLRTRYLHLERGSVAVRAGDRVAVGDRLGYMGKSGRATGEHLHFELLRGGVPADPEPFLREPSRADRTPTTSDALLRELAARPDSPRAAEFARLYEPVLRRYAARSGTGRRPIPAADRDDLVQEALLAVRRALPGFRYDPARGRFRAYLRRIVRNLALRQRAARERDAALASRYAADPPPAPDPSDALRLRVWTLALARVLDSGRFAPNTAAAFRRFALDGAPAEAVADEFGMKPNAVYQLKNRVLRAVRDELRRVGHGRLSLEELCDALEDGSVH